MLSEVFPEDEDSLLDLNSLSMEAALIINHGSPFLGDGLRWENTVICLLGQVMFCSYVNGIP
jgi:hypothetical protein